MSGRRRGLGRGLDALLGPQPSATEESAGQGAAASPLRDVAIDQLEPNRFQPRSQFAEDGLEQLAESIRAQGILQPLVVKQGDGGRLTIIAGERRWRAAKRAGLDRVPVLVKDVDDDQRLLEMALVENVQRADLDVIEEAEAYNLLASRFGQSQDAIARQVGKSRPSISNALRLLRLPAGVRDMLRDGRLTAGQARPLLRLGEAAKQQALAERAAEEGLSARSLEKLVARTPAAAEPSKRSASPEPDVHTRAAIDRLTRSLQTPVEIRRKRKGGEIRIRFHSEEELIRLFDHLTKGKGEP